MRVGRDDFAKLVEEALRELPERFRPHLEDVIIDVEDRPDHETALSMELDDPRDLLGLYHGTPLTERGLEGDLRLPDRIVLYRENILDGCLTRQEVIEEIRTTVLHEIGHHFGLEEDDLDELGFG